MNNILYSLELACQYQTESLFRFIWNEISNIQLVVSGTFYVFLLFFIVVVGLTTNVVCAVPYKGTWYIE